MEVIPMKHALSAVLAMFVMIQPCSYGQAVTGTINGLVKDPSGAVIAGAKVSVINTGTDITTNASTNEAGFYSVPQLIPGVYTVRISTTGFKELERTGVVLDVDSVARVDAELAIGSTSETILVASDAAVLKTDKADLGGVISGQTLNRLPVINRNVSLLVEILPGALRSTSPAFIGENPGSDTNGFVNGKGSGNNYHQLDGIENQETIQGVAMVNPNIDSLQEVKITTNSYDAEFGQVAGAVFQASTKSGTNAFHGTAFEYVQNNAFFARDPFTQSATKVAPWHWNQFGGSLGGPIKKDKIFFFADYQGLQSVQGSTLQLALPSAAMKQGDFSAVANQYLIYDPNTGNSNGVGRTPFPGNIIPSNRFSPVTAKLVPMLPDPNTADPSYTHNYTQSGSFTSNTNGVNGRVDYNFTPKTRLFVRYSYFGSLYDAPPIFGKVAGGPGFGPQAEIGGTRTQNLSVNLTQVVKPDIITEVRFGFSRFRSNLAQTDVGLQTANQIGLPGINQNTVLTDGLPQMLWNGPIAGGSSSYLGNPYANFYEVEQSFDYVNNWTYIKGAHVLKWGADLRPHVKLQRIDKSLRGAFTFSNIATALGGATGTTGLGFASFLLGISQSFSRGYYQQLPIEFQDRDGLYVQDQWRVRPNLTLTLGLRWEYYSPTYSDGSAREVNFNLDAAQMNFANVGPFNKYAGVQPDYHDFAPRFGLAYSINPKTVFRIGYGRSFAINTGGANFGTYCCQWPIGSQQSLTAPTLYTGVFPLTQGPPSGQSTNGVTIPSNGALPPADGQTVYGRPYGDKTTVQDAWNATIQRQITSTFTADISYVGSIVRHGFLDVNLNAPYPGPGPLPPRELYGILDGYQNLGAHQRGDVQNVSYNSLQTGINKRFSSGYQLTGAFTFQKTIADNYTDPFKRSFYKGPVSTPNWWVVISHVWQLPFGPGHRFGDNARGVARALIAGWEFTGVTQIQDGSFLTPSMNANTLNTNYAQLPNRLRPSNVANASAKLWFDPTAFAIPAAYTFGNTGTGIIRGPGQFIADWGLDKTFSFKTPLNESTRLVFRWEAFNALNHVNLANPTLTIDAPASQAGHIFDVQGTMRRMQLGLHLYF
jgi:hypothetical protein